SCGKLAEMMKALSARARSDRCATAPEKLRAGGPQPLQADVLMQAHTTHLGHRAAERPDRDAELTGEIGRIDRAGRIGCDVIVDLLYEPGGSRACVRGATLRQRVRSKQVVESEQQALLEM